MLGLAGLTAAACSSAPSTAPVASLPGRGAATQTTGPITPAQSDQDMVGFTRCLRSHGVAEPDPFHRPGHAGLSIEVPTRGPSTNAALTACNHFIAPIAQMKQAHALQQLASWLPSLTRYAQCMRSHDISMLDPDAQGSLNLGRCRACRATSVATPPSSGRLIPPAATCFRPPSTTTGRDREAQASRLRRVRPGGCGRRICGHDRRRGRNARTGVHGSALR